ncbi:fimbrial protein [Pantoea agglomerans]|uniref:Fimbrial protein n=1 Tax=Enterobacter agglomerans TaxID=549 RepID=A0ACC5RSM0_ENTAG|nr:fimbrial protein [Pantoea agglomerans]MBK4727654.1 fimbrial protein [Pantoea agglomerans]
MISSRRLWSKTWAVGLGAALLLVSPLVSLAISVVVMVSVTAAPYCEINGKQPIEVNFGEVLTSKVDGNNYRKDVLYDIKCSNTTSNDMSIRIQGTDANLGNSILDTNNKNLGIALMSSGQMVLNKDIKFIYPNVPKVTAVLMKVTGTKLQGGVFSAGATMTVTYH